MNDRDIQILFTRLMKMDAMDRAGALVRLFGYMDSLNSAAESSGNEKRRDEAQAFFVCLSRVL